MANAALIEDLRKQFAENPRRVFARLANEYRKSGDLDVAIEICRAHVPLQPTYISGYIVLGQALFERGQPDEARSTFETALALDPENLIALRQLGDIARASGDLDAARGWYHKLLEVDPQNDEVAAQLDALDAPQQESAASAPATASAPVEAAPVSWSDIHPDRATVTPLSPQAMRPRFTIGVIPENLAAPASERPAAPAPESPAAARAAPAPEPDLDLAVLPEYLAGYDRHAPTPPSTPAVTAPSPEPASASADASGFVDIADLAPAEPEMADAELPPISTNTAEHSAAVTAADLAALFGGPELETPSALAGAAEAASLPPDDGKSFEEAPYDPTIGRILELHRRAPSDALLPDLMMTESGAELLREQGHIDQAIYVYRHLAAKNPQDTSYAERIAALQRGAHSSIPLVASISDEVIANAKNRQYSTQSVRSFFTSFATRRAPEHAPADSAASAAAPVSAKQPAAPPESTASAPPRVEDVAPAPVAASAPSDAVSDTDRSALESLFDRNAKVAASDELAATSLASAFSEEYSPEPAGPAGQPTRAASDALSLDAVFQNSRTRADGEHRTSQPTVSFDEFFAHRENGGTAEGKGDTAVETASPNDDAQSDLELFHEWLDGLKK
jgi:tetratricopeptide (TPR) repeat protein